MVRYMSTRGGERGVPFERTLLAAYANDGGLYVPESLPSISKSDVPFVAGAVSPSSSLPASKT